MSVVRISDIHLYTGLTASASDSFAAKKWCDENKINYIHLHYGDDSQHREVFSTLSTWFPGQKDIVDFPIITYHEHYSDSGNLVKSIVGLKNIQNSNLVSLQALG